MHGNLGQENILGPLGLNFRKEGGSPPLDPPQYILICFLILFNISFENLIWFLPDFNHYN